MSVHVTTDLEMYVIVITVALYEKCPFIPIGCWSISYMYLTMLLILLRMNYIEHMDPLDGIITSYYIQPNPSQLQVEVCSY